MDHKYSELYTKLSRLQWLLQRYHMHNQAEHGPTSDPTRGQGRVLAMLKLQPEITTKDLSYLLGIRQQSLNELLNKLEKGGYILREPSDTDRRVMIVKLTEKGKGAQQPKSDLSSIFDCLSEEEQLTFGEHLDRVIAALEAQFSVEDQEDMEQWMQAARSRIGNELFDHLMSRRRGFQPDHDDSRFDAGWQPGAPFPEQWLDGFGQGGHGRHEHDPRRQGPHGHGQHRPGSHDQSPHDRDPRDCGRRGFDRQSFDGRGPAPQGMPGAERFDPDYDGPMPDRGQSPPFSGNGPQTPPPPAPEPPKAPHDPKSHESEEE